MTASIALSGTRTTRPRWARASDARVTCSSPAWAPAHRPAIPSWTVDGVFGIARTTGTPSARYRSTVAVGVAAAIVRTVCSSAITVPISLEQRLHVLRLHREDDERGARGGLDIARRRRTPYRSTSSATRSSRRDDAESSAGSRQPEERSPAISASPIRPAPRTAIRRSSTMADTMPPCAHDGARCEPRPPRRRARDRGPSPAAAPRTRAPATPRTAPAARRSPRPRPSDR